MSDATTAPGPTTQPAPWPASTDRRGCLARLLGLVRKLIDHGRQLAAAVGQRSLPNDPAIARCCFGTKDIALILSRITLALQRATALEARLLRSAARPDPKPQPSGASPPRPRRAPREPPQGLAEADPRLADLPTAEQIAAEIRRRPVGAVIADICRDLGIMADHPLWRELHTAIILHGGNLAGFLKDMFKRSRDARHERMNALAAASAPALPLSPEPVSTGPP
ncbi:MAG TPA: hypothetical protein VKI44_37750 [Acetobacteraceae bacterium]|nr:hypothetical protein [Acetobacteraceae bacterium]